MAALVTVGTPTVIDPWVVTLVLLEAVELLDALEDAPGRARISHELTSCPIRREVARPDGAIAARRLESAKTTAWER